MKNKSIWETEIKNNKKILCRIKDEDKYKKADILIIGGGITGLTLAYFLKDINKNIIVIDKGKLMSGVTCKTTAKLSFVQQDIYSKLNYWFGENKSKEYLDSQKEAISIIKEIIDKNNILCDLQESDSILFALKDCDIKKVKKEEKILNKLGIQTSRVESNDVKYGIKVKDNYVFHPLKYLNGIVEVIKPKVKIYENIIAEKIVRKNNIYEVKTNTGIIKANKVVLACHYPFQIIPGFIPIKTHVKREYVNAVKVDDTQNVTALSIGKKLHSIRYYNDYAIYGSNEHRITNKIDYKTNYDKSKEDFKIVFNKWPEYTWMNQDVISNDYLPFIGEIKSGMYLATAYNAWGMTNGTIAAKLLFDLIQDKENKYEKLFKPKRINMPLILNSCFGMIFYLKSYIEGVFHKSNPSYVKIDNMIYGIYTDENGDKHKVKLICPHMKCPLVFNREEKTWDCPCHGSRFDIDGNIIEGPANYNINK